MGFLRRLLNGRKRMEGFSGPDPSQEQKRDANGMNSPSDINNALSIKEATETLELYHFDNISVASYESGDQDPLENDITTLNITVSAATPSVYEGLELTVSEFRILMLCPSGNKKDDIHCTLKKATFKTNPDKEPVYEALSYVWGDAREKRIIYVNGLPFAVTVNLFVALKYLREADETRALWIDAVCIDQNNLVEKTHQVSMMKHIYRSASLVLLWLGESDKDIRKAIAHLELLDTIGGRRPTEESLKPFLPGLAKIFKKPWWSRLWVVQEVFMANREPRFGCGRKWFPWRVVRSTIFDLARRQRGSEGVLQNKNACFNLAILPIKGPVVPGHSDIQREHSGSLATLLDATCDRETTQPHDRIFALLGLAMDHVSDDVPVNYDQSYSITYQKAMVHVLKSSSNLDFLVLAMNYRVGNVVPSWCVDFSQSNWNNYTSTCGWYAIPQEQAAEGASGKQPNSTILHNPQLGTLKVSGTVVGCITHVKTSDWLASDLRSILESRRSEFYRREMLTKEQSEVEERTYDHILKAMMAYREAAQVALETRLSKSTVMQMLDSGITWKTAAKGSPWSFFLGNLTRQQREMLRNGYSALEAFVQKNATWSRVLSDEQSLPDSGSPLQQILDHWAITTILDIGLLLIDESLLITDTGHLGRAPTAVNAIAKGDLLCIIYGCRIPVILRSLGQAYKVVTFSYVTDLMDGEYFDGTKRQTQRFTLR
ncbi:MAG: hypothetical protein Q9209_005900 [Squamulea sp. 1 TL-2023]